MRPTVLKTWAKKGQTPRVNQSINRTKINIIGALTTKGQFISQSHECNVTQKEMARFLRHVLDWTTGKLLVVWDNARHHIISNEIKEVLKSSYGQRIIECVRLPKYAPELNPVELCWKWLKSQGIGNRCPKNKKDLKQLWRKVRHRFKSLVDAPALVRHCLESLDS